MLKGLLKGFGDIFKKKGGITDYAADDDKASEFFAQTGGMQEEGDPYSVAGTTMDLMLEDNDKMGSFFGENTETKNLRSGLENYTTTRDTLEPGTDPNKFSGFSEFTQHNPDTGDFWTERSSYGPNKPEKWEEFFGSTTMPEVVVNPQQKKKKSKSIFNIASNLFK